MSLNILTIIQISSLFASTYGFLFSTPTNTEPNLYLYMRSNGQNFKIVTTDNIKQ